MLLEVRSVFRFGRGDVYFDMRLEETGQITGTATKVGEPEPFKYFERRLAAEITTPVFNILFSLSLNREARHIDMPQTKVISLTTDDDATVYLDPDFNMSAFEADADLTLNEWLFLHIIKYAVPEHTEQMKHD